MLDNGIMMNQIIRHAVFDSASPKTRTHETLKLIDPDPETISGWHLTKDLVQGDIFIFLEI
jgi:hypothetical protein